MSFVLQDKETFVYLSKLKSGEQSGHVVKGNIFKTSEEKQFPLRYCDTVTVRKLGGGSIQIIFGSLWY